jgi:hypothetical protein
MPGVASAGNEQNRATSTHAALERTSLITFRSPQNRATHRTGNSLI